MATLSISKSSLKKQRDQLRLFERFLPSLDLKRQQLLTEYKRAQERAAQIDREVERSTRELSGLMEPLGAANFDLSGLVSLESAVIDEEYVMGARLPVLGDVKFRTAEYSTLAKPFWVDLLVENLERMARLRLESQVAQERLRRLHAAVRRITQRVNLFEKVLIPRAKQSIKRIQIGLAETERSAVVRSKIAKRKHDVPVD